MNPSHVDFVPNYEKLSEPELMEVARSYDTLTDTAQAALREEFARRGVEPPLVEDKEPPAQRNLVTVRRYRDLHEADVARSVLESAGLPVYLRDENLVRLDWPLSNMIGGVRLQVEAAYEQSAIALLSQPLPEAGEDFAQPRCPACGSSDVVLSRWVMTEPPPPGEEVWLCNACEERWEDTGG